MWVGALDDTDMCDKDVVIAQCGVLWMRSVERSEPMRLGCVLEKSEASWAITQVSSRAL